MSAKNILLISFIATSMIACGDTSEEKERLDSFEAYFEASKDDSIGKWDYTSDTIKLWFDDKENKPTLQIKGSESAGPWKEWDEEMNSTSHYDSIWYDEQEEAVKGYFYENNDFYELIGKGPTKTLRTYWFDDNNKIHEILIYWIPDENEPTSEYLQPIVAWAESYDSAAIDQLYPNGRLVPSRENAERWKALLKIYNQDKESD